ncbi:MAG: hypothetical protein AAGB04_26425 [Pseudomonadota bacterium]
MIRSLLGKLSVIILALGSMAVVNASQAQEAAFKQMKLSEAQIQNYLKAQGELNQQFEKIEKAGEQPDEKLVQGLEEIAKKFGFGSYDELDAVMSNISFVLSGFDQESGEFSEPVEAMKQEIAALKSDKTMPEKERKALIQELEEAVKNTPTVEHKENVALVKKHFKALDKAIN